MFVVRLLVVGLTVADAAGDAKRVFPVWRDVIDRHGRDELALLAEIEEATRTVGGTDLERFADRVLEEGGAVDRAEEMTGKVKRVIEITPFVRLGRGALPYSLHVRVPGGGAAKPGALQPVLTHIANAAFAKWKQTSGFEAGSFLETSTRLASAEAAAGGFNDLAEMRIEFVPTGGFHTELSAFCFRAEFLVVDARTLPARKRTLSYFALTGLRDTTRPDGSTLKRNGQILRAEPLEWLEPVAQTKDGNPIWSD